MTHNESFDHQEWLLAFRAASKAREGFRELRRVIYFETMRVVREGSYRLNGRDIRIASEDVAAQSEFFVAPPKLTRAALPEPTRFSVIEADCLETAEVLVNSGLYPCVLNLANRQKPGGGVLGGAGAQEENLFRRSNLFQSLYRYADFGEEFGVVPAPELEGRYPMHRDTGGVYSGGITVFRASENNGYAFLREPFQTAFVTVAAINRPDLERVDGGDGWRLADEFVAPTKEKMRTILRVAGTRGHDSLVLGAFGCGAFRNPPAHIAALFHEVFGEEEFRDKFRLVVFAIISDHNSWHSHNPRGNVLPFWEEFS
jgi:uncharacterized protein (TIGR02452 family)